MRVIDLLGGKSSVLIFVEPSSSLKNACEVMARGGVGAVPVLSDGRIVGILSERDVSRGFAASKDGRLDVLVSDLMTISVITCGPDVSVDALMRTMTERRIRHVPVVSSSGLPIGIVTIGDVVKALLSEREAEAEAMRSYISGLS
jgi:CBS domain-containing protein